ncbi:unnamed protein product [Parascedosporium putredinis]|uniref:Uncharacterized protein n=1 Tax=Parascedosporium putredinis TaxID=1442378 RepID=A0A9P1GWG0_9PEZI|nr:unnamed protein product [Parascedosporium putredinis]CAI7988244.1 unnamed protein product [Parascedosporium putredinis]
MGSTASKPAANGASYEWKGSSPIGASQDLVNSIQSNKETDASRAKLMEIHVETRVAEQLQKLHDNEAAALKEAREKLSSAMSRRTKR